VLRNHNRAVVFRGWISGLTVVFMVFVLVFWTAMPSV
jgi:hypothetical protein